MKVKNRAKGIGDSAHTTRQANENQRIFGHTPGKHEGAGPVTNCSFAADVGRVAARPRLLQRICGLTPPLKMLGAERTTLCALASLFVLMVMLVGPGSSPAQTTSAGVSGRITDPSGAVVVEAEVEIKNTDTNDSITVKTNGDGLYNIPSLKPGHYLINVRKAGFRSVTVTEVELNIQDNVVRNFAMQVGSITETVTINGNDIHINTTDATVGTVIDQTYIKNMPLNGRSFQDLILLTPGVVTETPQINAKTYNLSGLGQSGEFSVNGQRTDSNYYTVDGASADVGASQGLLMTRMAGASGSLPGATALGTTQALVSVDALQEFRVQSSTYSAEYGRSPGGQFAFETKSGTSQWHGTVYDYLRNNYFDANDWFNNYFDLKSAALRQNDFGGTFGGPVRIPGLYNGKDRTFFFVSYEGLRLTSPQPAEIGFTPDAGMRSTAPAALQPVLNAFPLPTGPDDAAAGFAQYVATWSNPSSLDSTSVRLDHVLNSKARLFFRFGGTGSNSARRGTYAAGLTPALNNVLDYTLRTYTGGISSVFSSRLSNDFRVNYSSNETTNGREITGFGGGTPVDITQLLGLPAGSGGVISFSNSSFKYSTTLIEGRPAGTQRQWNLVDATSASWGAHQFKFGVDYRRLAPIALQATPTVSYYYFGESQVQANSASTATQASLPAYPLYMNFSAFAQDEWRVSQRLSFSFGVRWDVNPAPGVTRGLKPYTIQGSSPTTLAVAPQGTPLWQTSWYNFAPRLGLAYVLHASSAWETVARGGAGVFFDTGQQQGSVGFNSVGFFASGSFQPGGTFPVLPPIPVPVNPPKTPYNVGPIAFPSHLQLPYTLEWNVSVEQGLGKSQALTLSYVGSHAARLLHWTDEHTPTNPNAHDFVFIKNGLTSDYDALQGQFRRRLSRGLTALASYTWNHCIDYGSLDWQYGYQRGNCDFDVRHSFSAAFSYDLPNVGHNGLVNAVLHHWGLDNRFTARTSFPVTLAGPPSFDLNENQIYAGLNLVPGQPIYLYGANCAHLLGPVSQGGNGELAQGQGCPGDRAVNPKAFSQQPGCNPFSCPPGTTPGNAPRNFVRGFGAWQTDLAVRREFPIYENLKLQFRAEAFNILNHPNFGAINPNVGQRTFGLATATVANSLGVLSPLYQMGGPRSMQFALKLVF